MQFHQDIPDRAEIGNAQQFILAAFHIHDQHIGAIGLEYLGEDVAFDLHFRARQVTVVGARRNDVVAPVEGDPAPVGRHGSEPQGGLDAVQLEVLADQRLQRRIGLIGQHVRSAADPCRKQRDEADAGADFQHLRAGL
ncbi:hypothetical protein D9M72_503230 [compost metagenome]